MALFGPYAVILDVVLLLKLPQYLQHVRVNVLLVCTSNGRFVSIVEMSLASSSRVMEHSTWSKDQRSCAESL